MTKLIATVFVLFMLAGLSACGGKEGRATEYLERAQKSFDQGDYLKAELDAKNTLQIDPNNKRAVKMMALLAEQQDKGREMFQFLQKSVDLDPNDIESHVKLGRIYVAVQRYEEAQNHADSALGINPADKDARVLNATIMHRQGDTEGARKIADEVLADSPRNAPALAFLASTYQEADPDKAIDLLAQAVKAEPDNEGLRKVKIALLGRLKRNDEVERELRDAIGMFPAKNEYRYSLANFLAANDKLDDAEQVLIDVVKTDDTDMTAKLFYAQFVGNNRNPEAAEMKLKEYISDEPDVYEYRFSLAQVYVMTKNFDKARDVYQRIIDKDARGPNGINARTKLASLKMINQDEAGARELIRGVLADEANNPEALLMRASLRLKEENSSAAITDLRTILRDNPTHENARLLLGKAHIQAGENNLALEEYKRLMDAYPNNVIGRRDLATLLVQAQRWEEVRTLLEVGVEQAPDDLQMTRMLIDAYMRQQEWELAEREAQRILDKDPDSAMGLYVLARISQSRGEYKLSIDQFKKALESNPDAIESITGLIRSYVRAEDSKGALAFLEKFSPEHPENVQAVTLWGEMLAREERWDEATAKNEEALALNNAWLPAYRNLIGIQLRANDMKGADATVARGLKVTPNNPDLLMLRASTYERESRWAEAIDIYAGLLSKNSSLDIAANNYVALIADHKNDPESLNKAFGYAQRFQNSDNPIFQDTLGWLYYRMGDLDEALPLLEQAVSRAGQLQQLRYHLGMTYFKLDQLDSARRELDAAVKNPNAKYQGFDEAKATLKLL